MFLIVYYTPREEKAWAVHILCKLRPNLAENGTFGPLGNKLYWQKNRIRTIRANKELLRSHVCHPHFGSGDNFHAIWDILYFYSPGV